jgi:head-tail adaptor
MVHTALPRDTTIEVYDRMIQIWAAISTVEKAELFEAMCLEVDELARLGIAAREGDISPEREKFLMMELRYGTQFATSVLGEMPTK